jgi:hypothetical protein
LLKLDHKKFDENISESDMGEEKSSKIYNYDSSYFSKKMQEVVKKKVTTPNTTPAIQITASDPSV